LILRDASCRDERSNCDDKVPMSKRPARIDRSSTTPVNCNIRSAGVDLPGSMWSMMQVFRVCAGVVKVRPAKLLRESPGEAGLRRSTV
jgi:hypothetical protein